jgi:hypothetical protein
VDPEKLIMALFSVGFRRILPLLKVSSDRIFASRHHASDVRVYTQVMFIVQDQPEETGIGLAWRSTLHPLFGVM